LRAASIAPAPAPSGRESKTNHQIDCEKEKPSRQKVVTKVLIAVTGPVPNLFISFAENTLASTVPDEMSIVIKLALLTGRLNSTNIAGHAEPNKESGRPKPIKTIYIKNKRKVTIFFTQPK
jgi:hypothetical protein